MVFHDLGHGTPFDEVFDQDQSQGFGQVAYVAMQGIGLLRVLGILGGIGLGGLGGGVGRGEVADGMTAGVSPLYVGLQVSVSFDALGAGMVDVHLKALPGGVMQAGAADGFKPGFTEIVLPAVFVLVEAVLGGSDDDGWIWCHG